MDENPRDVCAVDKLQVAVTPNLLDAIREAAYVRRLSIADYVRGSVQARLTLDGVSFPAMPPKPAPTRVTVMRHADDHPAVTSIRNGAQR